MTINQKDKDALYALIKECCDEAEAKSAQKPAKKRNLISGYEGRNKRGSDKLDIGVPNRNVRDNIVRFYEVYGRHTGVGQSDYLVHFLLHAMVSFDLDHGHHWGRYSEDNTTSK